MRKLGRFGLPHLLVGAAALRVFHQAPPKLRLNRNRSYAGIWVTP